MKIDRILFFMLFFTTICSAQRVNISYIAYLDNVYYEISENKKETTVVKYYLNESKLTRDTLHFTSLEEAKNKFDFEALVKTRRLQKESEFYKDKFPKKLSTPNFGELAISKAQQKDITTFRRIGLDFKTTTDTLYSFQFHENGNKELWYLSGNDSVDYYERFWCKSKKQPRFIPVHHEGFDVILVQRDAALSVVYYDKKKGVKGIIQF